MPQISNALPDVEQRFAGRLFLITGHTGFTGSWACLWLRSIGCEISGLALAPDTRPSLFTDAGLDTDVRTVIGDIADPAVVHAAIADFRPELILHLAAQP